MAKKYKVITARQKGVDININNLHMRSINNKDQIKRFKQCGCYYCQTSFDSSEISEWIDIGLTACCPNCGVDSVLPGITNKRVLKSGNKFWFSEYKTLVGKQGMEGKTVQD